MTTILINPGALQAIALASSTEQTRYYLNGVNVEIYKDGSYGLIATDGHRLHTLQTKLNDAVESNYILSTDDIKKAVSMAKLAKKEIKQFNKRIQITFVSETELTIKVLSVDKDNGIIREHGAFTTKPIDGTFPDWRRVIPSSTDNGSPVMAFNADYMADFGEATRLLNGKGASGCIEMTSTGKESPMLIKLMGCSDFLGVLMGMRF